MSDVGSSFQDHTSYARYKDVYSDSACMLTHALPLAEKKKNFSKQFRTESFYFFLEISAFRIYSI